MAQLLSNFLSTSLADALDSAATVNIVQSQIIKLDSNTSGDYIKDITAGSGIVVSGAGAHSAVAAIEIDSSVVATLSETQTLTNKTINFTDNTVTMTLGQLNAAVTGGNVASIAGSETLTNKTLTSPTITGPTITGPGSITDISTFGLRDATTSTHETRIVSNNVSPVLTADRTLTIDVNNADRTLSLTGDLTLAGNLTTSGAHATTLTTTGTTGVTLPTSGTLVSKDGSGDFSAGTITATFSGNLTGNVTGTVSDISNHSTTDLSEGNNLYYTTARSDSDAKNSISVTDNGGDGSLSYTASTGVISYTGPSATDVRAHFTGGTGIAISGSGVVSTTDGDIVHDNLSGFVANEHIDHTNVTFTAGNGIAGGGTIAANRTFSIDSSELLSLYGASIFADMKTRDGAASGMDADLLDGQHGSHYRIDVYDVSGTLLN